MRPIILLPTYNEKENIQDIINRILAELPCADIMVIDDNSPDGTASLVENMIATEPRISILKRIKKEGLGKAYIDAMKRIRTEHQYDTVVTMDADGSHDPRYLPALLDALHYCDLVIGSRYVKGGSIENWEKWRYILSRFGNLYARGFTMLHIKDLTAGFMAMRMNLLEHIPLESIGASGYAFLMDFKFHAMETAHGKITEIPIVFKSRRGGESKISRHIIREGLGTPLRLLFQRIF